MVLCTPDASPESWPVTPCSAALVAAGMVTPAKSPNTTIPGRMPPTYVESTPIVLVTNSPAAAPRKPTAASALTPRRGTSAVLTPMPAPIARPSGSHDSPPRSGDQPSTCCSYRVSMNVYAVNAAVKPRVATLTTDRVRLAKNDSGISGSLARRSRTTVAASRAAPASSGSSTDAESHGCEAAEFRPYTRQISPAVEASAPGTSRPALMGARQALAP